MARARGSDPLAEFYQMDMASMVVLIADRLGMSNPVSALLTDVSLGDLFEGCVGWCGTPAMEERAIGD